MIDTVIESVFRISHPRFLDTERGFQGELAALLRVELQFCVSPGDIIVEQEYQKRAADHGIFRRPDVIVHLPAAPGTNRGKGNYLVIELKRRAVSKAAAQDFARLDDILRALHYKMGIFLNIDSEKSYAANYKGPFRDRLHFLAVRRAKSKIVLVHEFFEGGELRTVRFERPTSG